MRYQIALAVQTILFSFLVCASFLLPVLVSAQVTVADGDVEVTFSRTPLFSTSNNVPMAPGAIQSGSITVQNNGLETESVWLGAVATSSTGLAGAVVLRVSDTNGILFNGNFAEFFATSSVYLRQLAPGANRTYLLTANFASSSGNQYQGTTMGFDLQVGFAGGAGVLNPMNPGGAGGGVTGTQTISAASNGNSPDGIVAGVATSTIPERLESGWSMWDYITATISDVFSPQRVSSNAIDQVIVSTGTEIDSLVELATTSVVYESQPVGYLDNSVRSVSCLELWFILLGALGLLARIIGMFTQTQTTLVARGVSWIPYLVFIGIYLLVVVLLDLTVGIGQLWGWVLFIVWVVYQLYDLEMARWHTQTIDKPRIILLAFGVSVLFTLPVLISWLCQWW